MFDLTFRPKQSRGKWFSVYGGVPDLDAKGFTLVSERGIPDVFWNTQNKTVSLLLGYNNNVMSGGRDIIYYATLYNTTKKSKRRNAPFISHIKTVG